MQRHRNESRKHFQGRGQRRRAGLRPQQWRQRVGRFVAAARRHHVRHRVVHFFSIPLHSLQVVPERSHHCLFHRTWFVGHSYRGQLSLPRPTRCPPFSFWEPASSPSTKLPAPVPKLVMKLTSAGLQASRQSRKAILNVGLKHGARRENHRRGAAGPIEESSGSERRWYDPNRACRAETFHPTSAHCCRNRKNYWAIRSCCKTSPTPWVNCRQSNWQTLAGSGPPGYAQKLWLRIAWPAGAKL